MTGKEFIKKYFIEEVNKMGEEHPYLGFLIMAIGIEFLGKAVCPNDRWTDQNPKGFFAKSIRFYPSLRQYKHLNENLDGLNNENQLYWAFRCGFAHQGGPNSNVTLSSKKEASHKIDNYPINLKFEFFYQDFASACQYAISSLGVDEDDKLNKEFFYEPGDLIAGGSIVADSSGTH